MSDSLENFHCNPPSIPSGMRSVSWFYSHWSNSGDAGPVIPFPPQTADNFIRDELTLRIRDVNSTFEGTVSCELTGDTETGIFQFCFYVHGMNRTLKERILCVWCVCVCVGYCCCCCCCC